MLSTILAFTLSVLSPQASESSALAKELAEAQGRIVVVNFWAVWCEPCKREIPMLDRVSRAYAGRGVAFIGVSIDDVEEIEKAKQFALQRKLSYPLIFGATAADMIAFRLGDSIPVTVILDREGSPRFRLVGEVDERDLRERIDSLLNPGLKAAPDELMVPRGMAVEHFRDFHEQGAGAEHALEEQRAREEGGSAVPG